MSMDKGPPGGPTMGAPTAGPVGGPQEIIAGAPPGGPLEGEETPGAVGVVQKVEIRIKKVYNLLLRGEAKSLLGTAKLSVAALWGPECRNLLLLQRSSRRVAAASSCEIEPQQMGPSREAVQVLEQLYGRVFINGRV